MPGGKSPGPSIKDPEAYEAIKKKLHSEHPDWSEEHVKSSAAAISNSQKMNKFMRSKS
jgi:hypothetical protein